MTRGILALIIVTFVGLIVLDRLVSHLAPDNRPAAGVPVVVAHVHPAFEDVPSRIQTNGNALTITLRATATRTDVGYTPTRFLFLVDPPNAPSFTLCDGEVPTCALPFDGSRLQGGNWTVTLRVYDNTGNSADTRTRLRVT